MRKQYTEWQKASLFLILFGSKIFLSGHKIQKGPVYPHIFSLSFFSSSGTHQFHHLDGYQVIDINSPFIFAFSALRF